MSDRNDIAAPIEGELRTFGTFIGALEDGQLHEDLTRALIEINERLSNHAIEHGSPVAAKLTLGITITFEDGVFVVKPDVKVKLPDGPRRKTIFYGTDTGRFSRQNPRQHELFAGPRPVRTA